MDFADRILNPESWFTQSWQMFEAASVLWENLLRRDPVLSERDSQRQAGSLKGALLLLGLSAENALKGAYVCKNAPDLSSEKLRSRHFHDRAHDLNEVASRLELSLDEDQVGLLTRLTTSIQWSSKYRAPLKKSDLDELTQSLAMRSTDLDAIEALIEDLQRRSGYSETLGWPESVNKQRQADE